MLVLCCLLPIVAAGMGIFAGLDLAAYLNAWSGNGTRGTFIAEVQKSCGGMPPAPATSCPWRGDFTGPDRRTRRENVELATSMPNREVREGAEIPVIDTGHSTKVFTTSGGTDRPVLEVGATVSCLGGLTYSMFAWRSWSRDRRTSRAPGR
jgi:hypothetical protein